MLGKRIAELRKEQNLTQEELAQALKITRSALSLYELGRRDPDTDTMQKFAEFFNVSVDYLLGRTNIRQQPSVLAAHRSDGYNDELPPEAREELEKFKDYIRHKYGYKPSNEIK